MLGGPMKTIAFQIIYVDNLIIVEHVKWGWYVLLGWGGIVGRWKSGQQYSRNKLLCS